MTLTRAQDCTLRVVGYGRMEEPYKALVRELGLDKRRSLRTASSRRSWPS